MADYTLSAKGTYDGSNFDRGIGNSQSKLEGFMEQARAVGQKVRSAMGEAVAKAADTITSSVGSIGAAVGALAVRGGISRALNIEQAQYKMRQMGMDVDSIMSSVKESVSGTKFGLDAAATSASVLGTSGVASGEAMTRALKSAAGVATISGDEMEDVASIFAKVAAQGKLQGDELMQLNERGINAADALAKHLGVTQADIKDLVKKGKIDFQTFSDAMYASFGEAAAGANDTFSGAMANVRAALSRTGEAFASPALGALQQVFAHLIPVVDAANGALKPLAERFAAFVSEHLPKAIEFIDGLRDKIAALGDGGFSNLSNKAKALAAVIGVLSVGSLGGLISQIPIVGGALGGLFGSLGRLATPVGTLVKGFGGLKGLFSGIAVTMSTMSGPMAAALAGAVALVVGLAAAFAHLMATNDEFRGTMTGLATSIGDALTPAFQRLGNLVPTAQNAFKAFEYAAQGVAPAVLSLVAAMAPLVDTIVAAAIPIARTLSEIMTEVMVGITNFVTPAIEAVTAFVAERMPQIQAIVSSAMYAIQLVIQTVWPYVRDVVSAAMGVIRAVVETAWPVIETVITSVMNVIQAVIGTVTAAIQGDWQGVWEGVKSIASSIWNGIKSVVGAAIESVGSNIGNVLSAIESLWDSAWNAVKTIVSSALNTVKTTVTNGIGTMMSAIGEIPGKIQGFFANAGSWLINAGKSIIDGLVSGITGAIGGAVSAVGDAVGQIRNLFPFSPAKEGPFSGRGWVLYSGMSIMDALVEGAESQAGKAIRVFGSMAGRIRESVELGDAHVGVSGAQAVSYPSPTYRDSPITDGTQGALLAELRDMRRELGSMKVYLYRGPLVGGIASEMNGELQRQALLCGGMA